jgi:hypothetical protein
LSKIDLGLSEIVIAKYSKRMEENNNRSDDMELNEQHGDKESFPVPVSSTSSLDSFCLATADLMQECDGNDELQHYNVAAMDVSNQMTGNSSEQSESLTINTTNTQPPNISSSVISPGTAGGAQTMRALLPPAMSLPQQQASTNQYPPLASSAPPVMTMSLSGTLAPPLGIGQHQHQQQQNDAAAQQHHLLIQAAPPHSGTLVSVVSGTTNTSVPEFLFQLTRMLTEDNREVIEWSNGTYRRSMHVSVA